MDNCVLDFGLFHRLHSEASDLTLMQMFVKGVFRAHVSEYMSEPLRILLRYALHKDSFGMPYGVFVRLVEDAPDLSVTEVFEYLSAHNIDFSPTLYEYGVALGILEPMEP